MSNLENIEKIISGAMKFLSYRTQCLDSQGVGIGSSFIYDWATPEGIKEMSLAVINDAKKLKKENRIKLKDPNAPKKPLTSYMFFCKEKRLEFKATNPEMKLPELSKVMGAEWRLLSDKKKSKYISKAEEDKKRYSNEMKDYEKPSDDELVKENEVRRNSGAKKALSSYMFFCKDFRPKIKESNPEMTMSEINKELGRKWREEYFSVEDRQRWERLAEEDKERFQIKKSQEQSDDLVIDEDLIVESDREKIPVMLSE